MSCFAQSDWENLWWSQATSDGSSSPETKPTSCMALDSTTGILTETTLRPSCVHCSTSERLVRVEPREEEEVDIEVVLSGKAHRVDGTLRDISVLGMGM